MRVEQFKAAAFEIFGEAALPQHLHRGDFVIELPGVTSVDHRSLLRLANALGTGDLWVCMPSQVFTCLHIRGQL